MAWFNCFYLCSGLTHLNIKYTPPQSKDQTLIPFTRYSGLYAFNLMPNLSVNLEVNRGYSGRTKGDDGTY